MIWNLDKVKNSNPHRAPGLDRGGGDRGGGLGVGRGQGLGGLIVSDDEEG